MSRIETYKKRPISRKVLITGILFSILMVVSSLTLLIYPFPSNHFEKYFKSDHPIVYRGKIYSQAAMLKGNEIYVPVTFIKEKIDPSIMVDQASNSVIVTTKNKVIQLPSESLTYFSNEKPFSLETPAVTSQNGIKYMALEPFKEIFNIQMNYQAKTGAVLIKKGGDTLLTGTIRKDNDKDLLRIRVKPDITTSYVGEVKPNNKVEVEKDSSGYYFVRKENGVGGYVKKSLVTLDSPVIIQSERQEKPIMPQPVAWPINLTWEAIYTKTPNPKDIPNTPGINIVSPTWFKVKNNEGDIANLGSMDYAKWADKKHYKIWGLFSNDFDSKKTHEAFKDYQTRQKMIRQLLQYSSMYKLSGINVDIENVNLADGPLVTQFMREATPYFHQAGLVVSMDITFISSSENWSSFYERDQLKDIADYLIVMAYDEHWANSPESGSVASFPWVEENLKRLLKIVPHDRLILGIPLYARLWKEKPTDGGNIEVSSKAYTMEQIDKWLKEKKVSVTIDKESGQYYGEYHDAKENATYKVWVENGYSLRKRAQLVHTYSLAGIASWARYFGNDEAWNSLQQSLKRIEATETIHNR